MSAPPRIAIVGAGAAGSMAAIFASEGDAETLLLERTSDGGRKILISGGGRCNVLPMRAAPERFVTDSPPRLVSRLLRSWALPEQVRFFEETLGVRLAAEPETGKLFPASGRARDVRDALYAAVRRRGVRMRHDTLVTGLEPGPRGWRIACEGAPPLEAEAVVIATGGLSIPRSGSDGRLLPLLSALGHAIHETYPALTPLTAPTSSPYAGLAGVSLPVAISARAGELRANASGGFLFTHRGYSGPAVLDVSHVAVRSRGDGGEPARLRVRWTPLGEAEWTERLRPRGIRTVSGALRAELPERLAAALAREAGVDAATPLSRLRRDDRIRLLETLVAGEIPWSGHEGYAKAEVTGGGIALDEIDPKTMESRRAPGLFLCGEILDAFGPIGGHNFQWAWATGRAAGLGAAARVSAPAGCSPGPR
ncbi:MAG: aminoacetone oxidase family FAD-binding enzyme [Syntrophomonadaceae bacterium]